MNEQIKLLTEQAKAYATDSTKDYTGNEPIGFMDYYTEKFAELIVRECMWKIMQRKEEAIHVRVDEAMSAALLDISEHFGVEE